MRLSRKRRVTHEGDMGLWVHTVDDPDIVKQTHHGLSCVEAQELIDAQRAEIVKLQRALGLC